MQETHSIVYPSSRLCSNTPTSRHGPVWLPLRRDRTGSRRPPVLLSALSSTTIPTLWIIQSKDGQIPASSSTVTRLAVLQPYASRPFWTQISTLTYRGSFWRTHSHRFLRWSKLYILNVGYRTITSHPSCGTGGTLCMRHRICPRTRYYAGYPTTCLSCLARKMSWSLTGWVRTSSTRRSQREGRVS